MSETPSPSGRQFFRGAAFGFSALVLQIAAEDWDRPALGVWNVRDLVGHTSRALSTIESYLGQPSAAASLDGPVAYFLAARAALGDPDAVAKRGREAGAALGEDPAASVLELANRVFALVDGAADDSTVATPVGVMTLAGYLPTRAFELTVHSLDIARALALAPPEGLDAAIGAACELAGQLAARSPRAAELLLLLTGRPGLPAGLSIL